VRAHLLTIGTLLLLASVGLSEDPKPTPPADAPPKATGLREDKKLTFSAKGIPDGAKATLAMLESCHSSDWAGPKAPAHADLKKAQEKDHIRLVFAKPVKVRVKDDTIEISELVFDGGAFWIRSGDKVIRRTKYLYDKEKAFDAWCNRGQTEE
jgi:hypothetical protein